MVLNKSACIRICSCVSLAVTALLGASQVRAQALLHFPAVADSYVDSFNPNTNYGLSPFLEVSGGALPGTEFRHTFVKFDLSTFEGPLSAATLVLYGQHVNPAGTTGSEPDTAWGVTDNSWTTLGITWNNQPAMGPEQSTTDVSTLGYYDWDVTSFVQSQLMIAAVPIISLEVTEALVPGTDSGYDEFGAGPRPGGVAINWPAPDLDILVQ
jgi:hypothetical protein